MRLLIVLTLLTGWLVAEIKDFIHGGGISNTIAFGLLKISILLFVIITLIIMISFYDIFMATMKKWKQSLQITENRNYPYPSNDKLRFSIKRRNSE